MSVVPDKILSLPKQPFRDPAGIILHLLCDAEETKQAFSGARIGIHDQQSTSKPTLTITTYSCPNASSIDDYYHKKNARVF